MILHGARRTNAASLEAGLDQCYLLSAILDRPVASSLADDLELFKESALVPGQANLRDLAIVCEQDKVCLEGVQVSMKSSGRKMLACAITGSWKQVENLVTYNW